jgi:sensor histidine kinase regulating citrate/malate metabolism
MRELSLHILDLVENSIRAGASLVFIGITVESEKNFLEIRVEDNGPGFDVPEEKAFDPFYTTKEGKKTGLGLSLFRGTAQRAGGDANAQKSQYGGAAVRATMQLKHVDRSPFGDVASSLAGMVCTNPQIDFQVYFSLDGKEQFISSAKIVEEKNYDSLAAAEKVYGWVKEVLRIEF